MEELRELYASAQSRQRGGLSRGSCERDRLLPVLQLAWEVPVMLTENLSLPLGLVNGARSSV